MKKRLCQWLYRLHLRMYYAEIKKGLADYHLRGVVGTFPVAVAAYPGLRYMAAT